MIKGFSFGNSKNNKILEIILHSMPRKKEKLIKALQINFNSLAAICDVELWKYTPLAVGMEFEYYGQYDNPRTTL